MLKVRIMCDFLAFPVWVELTRNPKNPERDHVCDIIDNDSELQKLGDEIEDMFSSYYYFDYKDLPCWFDEEQQKADKPKMLALIQKLHDRLDEINDGSFVVVDEETPYLEAL